MKLFVTGGTGFVGSHFLRAALAAGHEVRALRRPGASPRIRLELEPEWVEGDLTQFPVAALAGCDALVHLAATGVNGRALWSECFTVNVMASLELWQRAAEAGVGRFIICGSCFEYGRSGKRYEFIPVHAPLEPTAPYSSSKAAATAAALGLAIDRQLRLSVLRPFQIFGEGEEEMRLWPALRKAALEERDFPMTAGEQIRDFIPVEQVAARFLAELISPPPPGLPRIANVGTGVPRTIRSFAEEWKGRFGSSNRLLFGAVPYRPHEIMRYVPEI